MKYAVNLLVANACLLLATTAHAGYRECQAAYEKNKYSTAWALCLPLAKQGDPKAQNTVGRIYLDGKVVVRDYAEAKRWF